MSDENKTRDVIDAVTGLAKEIPIYTDMIQPAAKEFGKGLIIIAKAVNRALESTYALVWKSEEIKEYVSSELSERLASVPPDNIVPPAPNVAGPALEALRYAGSKDELRELFTNLLASAMNKTSMNGALPAFVEIIKQMTPDEAKLFSWMAAPKLRPIIDLQKVSKEREKGQVVMLKNYSHFGENARCEHQELVPIYIDNLCRLGLIEIPLLQSYAHPNAYDSLEKDPKIIKYKEKIESDSLSICEIQKKAVELTEFGKQFAAVCIMQHKQ